MLGLLIRVGFWVCYLYAMGHEQELREPHPYHSGAIVLSADFLLTASP